MRSPKILLFVVSAVLTCAVAHAQSPVNKEAAVLSQQMVHLSASASSQVTQDWLIMTLTLQKEGLDASAVQKQVKAQMASALALSQNASQTGLFHASTGQWSVTPRYGRDGKTNGWIGVAELLLQGRDVERITDVAGRLSGLTISDVQWQVSPELRHQTESEIQGQAVALFQARASALASSFGFKGYLVREVRVTNQDSPELYLGVRSAPMPMYTAATSTPIPAQAGQSRVSVTVSGSIELR